MHFGQEAPSCYYDILSTNFQWSTFICHYLTFTFRPTCFHFLVSHFHFPVPHWAWRRQTWPWTTCVWRWGCLTSRQHSIEKPLILSKILLSRWQTALCQRWRLLCWKTALWLLPRLFGLNRWDGLPKWFLLWPVWTGPGSFAMMEQPMVVNQFAPNRWLRRRTVAGKSWLTTPWIGWLPQVIVLGTFCG